MSQENSKNHLSYLQSINHIVFELNDSNIEASIDELVNLFDANYSYSINLELCHMILSSFRARKGNIHTNLRFLKKFHEKEESEKLFDQNPIEIFLDYINTRKSYPRHETIYLEEMLIEDGYYKADDLISNYSMFFIHHKPNLDPQEVPRFLLNLARSYGEGQDPIELHKKLFQEGVNPTKIAEIIRNDNVEQLQELSTQVGFSYNQTIERSHYETCVLLNRYSVSIVDYAAFFSAVKCFKYLHMNGADIHKTGEYAVAGGNIEIIHLCEQNNSSFEGAYVTAIEFHQNDIFKYIYENKLEESANLNVLGKKCIVCNNYEILSYLIEKNLEINDDIINKAAKTGNLFLVKYFLEKHQIPKNILAYATRTSNYELVEFIIKKDGIDINAKSIDVVHNYLAFVFLI